MLSAVAPQVKVEAIAVLVISPSREDATSRSFQSAKWRSGSGLTAAGSLLPMPAERVRSSWARTAQSPGLGGMDRGAERAPEEFKVKSYGVEIPVGLGGSCLLHRSFQEHDFGLPCLRFLLRTRKLFLSQLTQAKHPRQLVHWGNNLGKPQQGHVLSCLGPDLSTRDARGCLGEQLLTSQQRRKPAFHFLTPSAAALPTSTLPPLRALSS